VLGARWIDLEAGVGMRLVLDTGTVSVLGYHREARVIRLWNRSRPGAGVSSLAG
jgi:hypothetical protein